MLNSARENYRNKSIYFKYQLPRVPVQAPETQNQQRLWNDSLGRIACIA